MNAVKAKSIIGELLSLAGITINGHKPWDIQVYNEDFFNRALLGGSLTVGETYIDNWWDCFQLDEFYNRVLNIHVQKYLYKNWKESLAILLSKIVNFQTASRAMRSGQMHYNLGNDLFTNMLDRRLIYTCAYWKGAATLNEAQESKLELVCRKLDIQPGMTVMDIGCGWGGFANYAAEKFKVKVTGITVSEEQVKWGRQLCANLPVNIQLQDYRSITGTYDRIVSLGMFEHVGYKNYRSFMKIMKHHLADDGLFLLHTIGANQTSTFTDPWLNRYIFPGSMLPSIRQIGEAIEGLFVMEDWHNFSADYDKTLMAWQQNFSRNWQLFGDKYGEKFYRMWNYYLLSCAGSFRARRNQLWQIVLSKKGVPGGYISIR